MNIPPLLLLLSGPIASGKTTLRDAFSSNHKFLVLKTSDYLRALAKSQGLEPHRINLQDIGDKLDRETDYRWIIDKVAIPSFSKSPHENWIIDAVRKRRQVEHFKHAFGRAVYHVHTIASEHALATRYNERLKLTESRDSIPYEIAVAHENEISSRALIKIADLVIDMEDMDVKAASERILSQVSRRTRK